MVLAVPVSEKWQWAGVPEDDILDTMIHHIDVVFVKCQVTSSGGVWVLCRTPPCCLLDKISGDKLGCMFPSHSSWPTLENLLR